MAPVLLLAILALAVPGILTAARAGFVRSGELLVSFDAGIKPTTLPRSKPVPIEVGFKGSFENLDATDTPALRTMVVRLSRGGRIDSAGLPRCSERELRERSSAEALAVCGDAKVGEGTVRSALRFPDGHRLRSTSRLLLFNGDGEILMHIFTTAPLRGVFVVPMKVHRGSGAFATVLTARFPQIAAGYGYLTGFEMTIERTFQRHGRNRSYVVASCAAPKGLSRVVFEVARVTYRFKGGITVRASAIRSCRVAR
jgi:hypothetical protein